MTKSRNELALENLLGADNVLPAPQSRNEKILQKILGVYSGELEAPQSRIEVLLQEIYNEGFTTEETFYQELLQEQWGS